MKRGKMGNEKQGPHPHVTLGGQTNLLQASWGYICPTLCVLLVVVSITPPFAKADVMDARSSKPFPEGGGAAAEGRG